MEKIIADSAKKVGLKINTISLAKNTDTVRRYKVTYFLPDNTEGRLKVESSLRDGFQEDKAVLINDILVYNKEHLASLKLAAFHGRTAARDLHDLVFLATSNADLRNGILSDFIKQEYANLNELFNRFFTAYQEDELLKERFLDDLSQLKSVFDMLKPGVINDDENDFRPI